MLLTNYLKEFLNLPLRSFINKLSSRRSFLYWIFIKAIIKSQLRYNYIKIVHIKIYYRDKRLFCTFIDIIRENNRIIKRFGFETKINLKFYCVKLKVYFCFKAKPRDYPVFLAYYVNKSAKKTFIIIKFFSNSFYPFL